MNLNHHSKSFLGSKSCSNYLLNPNCDPLFSSGAMFPSSDDDIPKLLTIGYEQSPLEEEAKLWPVLPLYDLFIDLSSNLIDESNCLTKSGEQSRPWLARETLLETEMNGDETNSDDDAADDDSDDMQDSGYQDDECEDKRDEKENYTSNNLEVKPTILTIVPVIANVEHVLVSTTTPCLTAPIEAPKLGSPMCCRKHEKFYHKLLAKKFDRPINVRRFIVKDLYLPMDNGSYLKPKFSHNMLCAFSIIFGSDSDFKIEVADIYRFLGKCFPYFETAELHWRNSLRHSLATCNWFVKSEFHRTAKKGYKWTINNENLHCMHWEIKKQCIKDITRLYHCLSGPEVCHHLIGMGLLEVDQPTLTLLRESCNP